MASAPRSDIYINLPALQKLDMMLIVRQPLFAKSCTLFSEERWFLLGIAYKNINFSFFDRKYWIVSKIQNSGMQNKGACQGIQFVQAHFESLLRGKKRNGGCLFHV